MKIAEQGAKTKEFKAFCWEGVEIFYFLRGTPNPCPPIEENPGETGIMLGHVGKGPITQPNWIGQGEGLSQNFGFIGDFGCKLNTFTPFLQN